VGGVRLTELEPHWCADFDAPGNVKQGLTFLCPCCKAIRLGAWFDVPVCGSPAIDPEAFRRRLEEFRDEDSDHPAYTTHIGRILWKRNGNTFDVMTLTPSIDASKFGHWHGFITNGAIA
jgi:hypothetical protein